MNECIKNIRNRLHKFKEMEVATAHSACVMLLAPKLYRLFLVNSFLERNIS